MASAVAGAIQSIGTALIAEGSYLYGVEDIVRDLQKDLKFMQFFLQNKEANSNSGRERDALRLLSAEMTVLVNRAYDAIRTYRLDVGSKVSHENWLLKLFCLVFHFCPVHMLRKEIEAIQTDIGKANKRFEDFSKIPGTTFIQPPPSSSSRPNPERYLHLKNEFVVGIENDIADLVRRLTDVTDDFSVLGIVGTGGAGKSTLAAQIYRNDQVQSWFSHKAFVSVSQQWDPVDLFSRIWKQITQVDDNLPSNEKELSELLHAFMKGKQCLVVLDDIWTTEACDAIYSFLPDTKGIRVVITTRIEEVAKHPSTRCIIHKPKLLTEEKKLELFKKVAVDGRNDIDYDIGFSTLAREMLAKIEGIPLAVVTLGGILRKKKEWNDWNMVNKACSNNILKGRGGARYGVVKEMLQLSYHYLPAHEKDCFQYLGIIPEDREFSCQKIAQMWIAEGFITCSLQMGEETLEDRAMSVVLELADRCIIQIIERDHLGQAERFRVHDLMREFSREIAKEGQFLQIVTSTSLDHEPRRLSIYSREYVLEVNQQLTTLVYHRQARAEGVLNLDSIHEQFRQLGVLSIHCFASCTLSNKIGNLKLLTYLSLVNCGIFKLPESIRDLQNLLYFEYRSDAATKVVIPNNLAAKMLKLRLLELHISLKDSVSSLGLSEAHKELHTLKSVAGKWITNDLKPALSSPIQNLHICELWKDEEMAAIYEYQKGNLLTLSLTVSESAVFALGKLSNFQSVRSLYFHGPVSDVGPFQFPPNLAALTLSCTAFGEGVHLMEVLGELSALRYLRLEWNAFSGEKLSCASNTAFPQLQELRLECLDNLEEWEMETGAMRHLKKIGIRQCLKLVKLPACIGDIATLRELEAQVMSEEFCRRLGYGPSQPGSADYGVDSAIIGHIQSVKVTARSV